MAPWLIQLLIIVGTLILSIFVGAWATTRDGSYITESNNTEAKANIAYCTRFFTIDSILILAFILCLKWWNATFFLYAALVLACALVPMMFFFLTHAFKPQVRAHRCRLAGNAALNLLAAVAMVINICINLMP